MFIMLQLSRVQEDDGDYMKSELSQVRQELHALRDRNHQLMDDNIKLTEHLKRFDTAEVPQAGYGKLRSPGYDATSELYYMICIWHCFPCGMGLYQHESPNLSTSL